MTDDHQQDQDWSSLSGVWQEAHAEQSLEMEKLTAAVNRKTWQMRLMFGFEILTVLMAIGVACYMLSQDYTPLEFYVAIALIPFSLWAGWYGWDLRRNIWRAEGDSVMDQVDLSLKRAKASIRYAKMNLWATPPMLAFIITMYLFRREEFDTLSVAAVDRIEKITIFGVVMILATAVWAVWYLGHHKKNADYWQSVKAEMERNSHEEE